MASEDGTGLHCDACGRPWDLRCEDCGCPVTCHRLIVPGPSDDKRVLYCGWDGPCWNEHRPVFIAAVVAWQEEVRRFTHRTNLGDSKA